MVKTKSMPNAPGPAVIADAPNGALCRNGPNGNGSFARIEQITTSGAIRDFAITLSIQGGIFGIVVGPDKAMWFAAQSSPAGGLIGRITVPPTTSPLLAAVLPSSWSIELCNTATAFATMINAGTTMASGCSPSPVTPVPAHFTYQTTDPATNALIGSPDTPASIPAGAAQSFVFTFTPNAPVVPMVATLGFSCSGMAAAPSKTGLNTLLYSASASPVPDVVALAATVQNDGTLHKGSSGSNAFPVATVNVGADAQITASPGTSAASLPVRLFICQTNPQTGACVASPAGTMTATINAGATPTFGVFGTATGAIPFDPANNRIIVQSLDSAGVVRGSTSVAVRNE